jgi:hypothetical protein
MGTTGNNGYHIAANAIAHDETMANIETTLTHKLTNLHVANNAQHQFTLASIAKLCTALMGAQQQLALLILGAVPWFISFFSNFHDIGMI